MLFLFSVSGEDKPVMTNIKMMDHVIALQRMREKQRALKKAISPPLPGVIYKREKKRNKQKIRALRMRNYGLFLNNFIACNDKIQ